MWADDEVTWHMGRLLEHVHQVRMANGTSTKPIVMLPVILLHGWIHASAAPMKKWLMDHYVEGATVVGVANIQAHWIPIIAFPGEVLHVHTFDNQNADHSLLEPIVDTIAKVVQAKDISSNRSTSLFRITEGCGTMADYGHCLSGTCPVAKDAACYA